MKRIDLGKENEERLAAIRLKHPHRSSVCGALFAEVSTASDMSDRSSAAILMGLLKCRRGLQTLMRLIAELRPSVEANPPYEATPEYHLLSNIIWSVGWMDTEPSHACLAGLLESSRHPSIKDFVFTAMAMEEEFFDVNLIFPSLTLNSHREELLGALYALMYQSYILRNPEDCRKRVEPFLKHENAQVRIYAIEALKYGVNCRDCLTEMLNDSEPGVCKAAEEAIAELNAMESEDD